MLRIDSGGWIFLSVGGRLRRAIPTFPTRLIAAGERLPHLHDDAGISHPLIRFRISDVFPTGP
jgi:hypothetical protein